MVETKLRPDVTSVFSNSQNHRSRLVCFTRSTACVSVCVLCRFLSIASLSYTVISFSPLLFSSFLSVCVYSVCIYIFKYRFYRERERLSWRTCFSVTLRETLSANPIDYPNRNSVNGQLKKKKIELPNVDACVSSNHLEDLFSMYSHST